VSVVAEGPKCTTAGKGRLSMKEVNKCPGIGQPGKLEESPGLGS
jgi:hypothetical protein